jgi:imidazole glycerol phosphate synthase glutamine amidotransferase subunit
VVIVDSGVANLASIAGAFRRLGVTPVVSADAGVVRDAARIVLPGVGAFGTGMASLRSRGLDAVIRDHASRGTPILAICLGMQLLCEASEETPGVTGLGIALGTCRRLPGHVRIPHLGWNAVSADQGARFVATGVAAFANSYALHDSPDGWTAAWTTHGVPFVAALERGPLLACQFHPELRVRTAPR